LDSTKFIIRSPISVLGLHPQLPAPLGPPAIFLLLLGFLLVGLARNPGLAPFSGRRSAADDKVSSGCPLNKSGLK
jgi:hypothetical protein